LFRQRENRRRGPANELHNIEQPKNPDNRKPLCSANPDRPASFLCQFKRIPLFTLVAFHFPESNLLQFAGANPRSAKNPLIFGLGPSIGAEQCAGEQGTSYGG
jgi:hypothetical protein